MAANKLQFLSNFSTRQKATIGVFIVVVVIILWQVIGLFHGGGGESTPSPAASNTNAQAARMAQSAPSRPQQPQIQTPQPSAVPRPPVLSEREMELLKLQQETEAKYISALNELQMLKVEREIAENNKAIMTAKLDTVTAEKNIVDLLTKPVPQVTPAGYAQGLVAPVASGSSVPAQVQAAPAQPAEINYSVISVSQLQYKWSAVLGYQGNLYNVAVGDILPPDRSRVIAIDKGGVVIEKNGAKKRLSMVPII